MSCSNPYRSGVEGWLGKLAVLKMGNASVAIKEGEGVDSGNICANERDREKETEEDGEKYREKRGQSDSTAELHLICT